MPIKVDQMTSLISKLKQRPMFIVGHALYWSSITRPKSQWIARKSLSKCGVVVGLRKRGGGGGRRFARPGKAQSGDRRRMMKCWSVCAPEHITHIVAFMSIVTIHLFTQGVLYDLFECLYSYMDGANLTSIPIYFISPVADSSLAYSNIFAEWYGS